MRREVVALAVDGRPPTICEICPERPVCREPCSRVEQLIGPVLKRHPREFGSDELVRGQRFGGPRSIDDSETYGRSKRLAALHGPRLRGAVEALPVIQRIVVEGMFFDGRSDTAMALQLGADVRFVRRILSVGLEALRNHIGSLPPVGTEGGKQ